MTLVLHAKPLVTKPPDIGGSHHRHLVCTVFKPLDLSGFEKEPHT